MNARPIVTDSEPNVAAIAALLGDRSRATICLALLDGRAMPASELASRARISPQTASNHLNKLVRGQIIELEQQGRWRYYRLKGDEVAHAVESLAVIAPATRVSMPPKVAGTQRLHQSRSCYSHFAGKFGVALTDALLRERWIQQAGKEFAVTASGRALFAEIGIDVALLRHGRRPLAYRCLDWSERRHHLAGPLGTAIMKLALDRDWVRRLPSTRAILITSLGRSEVRRLLRISV